MKRVIKIGTRDSQLAIWQGKEVQKQLAKQNIQSELIFIKSDGDIHLTQPLYELGVQGIFTKALDTALLNNEIDIAVHSYKDVPTSLAKNTVIASVLKRDTWQDVFISKEPMDELVKNKNLVVATSSTRRKAQWLNKYPTHQIENIRGNINSRVKKLMENKDWSGTILSKAGVERINLQAPCFYNLDWMLPAPAQGTVVVTSRINSDEVMEACQHFNDKETSICTGIEKDFLRNLMGGCTTPIGALAVFANEKIYFRGNVLSTDGLKRAEVEMFFEKNNLKDAGKIAAEKLKANGGDEILKELKKLNHIDT